MEKLLKTLYGRFNSIWRAHRRGHFDIEYRQTAYGHITVWLYQRAYGWATGWEPYGFHAQLPFLPLPL